MKKFAFLIFIAAALAACNQQTNSSKEKKDSSTTGTETHAVSKDSLFGKTFDSQNPVELTSLMEDVSKLDTTRDYVVAATLTTVCQARGCWFRAEDGKGGDVFVKILTEDDNAEEVGIPMTSPAGTHVVFYGKPRFREVSVRTLREYAKDAGKSSAEIKAINQPKKEWRFFATGVVVKS